MGSGSVKEKFQESVTHRGQIFVVNDKFARVKLTPRYFLFGVKCQKLENFDEICINLKQLSLQVIIEARLQNKH